MIRERAKKTKEIFQSTFIAFGVWSRTAHNVVIIIITERQIIAGMIRFLKSRMSDHVHNNNDHVNQFLFVRGKLYGGRGKFEKYLLLPKVFFLGQLNCGWRGWKLGRSYSFRIILNSDNVPKKVFVFQGTFSLTNTNLLKKKRSRYDKEKTFTLEWIFVPSKNFVKCRVMHQNI